MAEHLHFIEHRHRAGDSIDVTFICKGDRSSPCHFYPGCDCEFWYDAVEHEKKHPKKVHDTCWIEGWMNLADCAQLCGPDGELVRNGPVSAWFEDCIMWDYVEEEDKK